MTTAKMLAFIVQNQASKIIYGERRTADNKPISKKSDLEKPGLILYKFDNGSTFYLSPEDLKSAPDFKPVWDY